MNTLSDRGTFWRTVCLVILALVAGHWAGSSAGFAQREGKPARIDEDLYVGIRPGMMIPFFGSEPPKGFVWADGVAVWPDAEWVPKRLRGKGVKVPDMRQNLLAGGNEDQVGLPGPTGTLELEEAKVDVSGLKLPAMYTEDRVGGPGFYVVHGNDAETRPLILHGYEGNTKDFFLKPAKYNTFDKGARLAGSAKIAARSVDVSQPKSLPRHIVCRWIIRIQ